MLTMNVQYPIVVSQVKLFLLLYLTRKVLQDEFNVMYVVDPVNHFSNNNPFINPVDYTKAKYQCEQWFNHATPVKQIMQEHALSGHARGLWLRQYERPQQLRQHEHRQN